MMRPMAGERATGPEESTAEAADPEAPAGDEAARLEAELAAAMEVLGGAEAVAAAFAEAASHAGEPGLDPEAAEAAGLAGAAVAWEPRSAELDELGPAPPRGR